MAHETQPLDYRTAPPGEQVRPRLWLSHMLTAGLLCVVALFVDRHLRFDWGEAGRVTQIELALALYGTTCAIVSLARGALETGDRFAVAGCLVLFGFTAYVGLLMPRVIHN
jgi:hypothetical protein